MKKFLIILFLSLLSFISFSQLPINENFNTQPSAWNNNNGSGYYNYGGGNYTLTTNINQYPNSSTITMLSPIYDLSNCLGVMTVSFLLNGEIENNWDFMSFQYLNSSNVWITLQTFTGVVNNQICSYTSISNTATQFRFRLSTDASINPPWYYYDIDNFSITCDSYLPIELISFEGIDFGNYNLLTWSSASEHNNDYYLLERSIDGINWSVITNQKGVGNSINQMDYIYKDFTFNPAINYYRLSQVDFDGQSEIFEIISINNIAKKKVILYFTNLLGQIVNEEANGFLIVHYSDGTSEKMYK